MKIRLVKIKKGGHIKVALQCRHLSTAFNKKLQRPLKGHSRRYSHHVHLRIRGWSIKITIAVTTACQWGQ